MSAAAALRVGWCPGALRPMMSGDGLIVRVKPRCATLTAAQARGIAAAAVRHGNGLLDLTARANLQIRGVSETGLPALTADLDALALLDADAGAEARRNVVASPLMGLDPAAAFDIRPAVAALESRLAAATDLAALPSKFGFAVSDGGVLALDGMSADVRFDATAGELFAVTLDGDEGNLACCTTTDMPEVALRLARAFADASAVDPDLHRMRDLVASIGARAVMDRARLEPVVPVAPSTTRRVVPLPQSGEEPRPTRRVSSPAWGRGTARRAVEGADGVRPPTTSRRTPVGVLDLAGAAILGVAAPFGRLDAAQLDALARVATGAGAADLRLTPWRAVLVPGLAPAAAARLAAPCAAVGWIVDPADPRLGVAACAGEPGCRRATTPVLDHAARWATLLGPAGAAGGIALHVSGCAKGCAHPGAAALTLVAQDGRYALVADGTASDAPLAEGLDVEEAGRLLTAILGAEHRP